MRRPSQPKQKTSTTLKKSTKYTVAGEPLPLEPYVNLKTKQKQTNKKPARTVAYLLLLSNISQEILPGMASVFYSFYFYLPEKYIS